eukprot:MONOS_16158.1-p1 / transcript=MONOS_16158.1 / gene=MONOS_16158 / organism=Monocercomonoides_exilis_PA203 / gene_product=unspecified product / transcript_product=unspecified product / location=Mono_scaffold01533:1629-3566(-) / protein_length=646 / sequence_SO=supercontig / SO=protein_coding / is_pseudo=false
MSRGFLHTRYTSLPTSALFPPNTTCFIEYSTPLSPSLRYMPPPAPPLSSTLHPFTVLFPNASVPLFSTSIHTPPPSILPASLQTHPSNVVFCTLVAFPPPALPKTAPPLPFCLSILASVVLLTLSVAPPNTSITLLASSLVPSTTELLISSEAPSDTFTTEFVHSIVMSVQFSSSQMQLDPLPLISNAARVLNVSPFSSSFCIFRHPFTTTASAIPSVPPSVPNPHSESTSSMSLHRSTDSMCTFILCGTTKHIPQNEQSLLEQMMLSPAPPMSSLILTCIPACSAEKAIGCSSIASTWSITNDPARHTSPAPLPNRSASTYSMVEQGVLGCPHPVKLWPPAPATCPGGVNVRRYETSGITNPSFVVDPSYPSASPASTAPSSSSIRSFRTIPERSSPLTNMFDPCTPTHPENTAPRISTSGTARSSASKYTPPPSPPDPPPACEVQPANELPLPSSLVRTIRNEDPPCILTATPPPFPLLELHPLTSPPSISTLFPVPTTPSIPPPLPLCLPAPHTLVFTTLTMHSEENLIAAFELSHKGPILVLSMRVLPPSSTISDSSSACSAVFVPSTQMLHPSRTSVPVDVSLKSEQAFDDLVVSCKKSNEATFSDPVETENSDPEEMDEATVTVPPPVFPNSILAESTE